MKLSFPLIAIIILHYKNLDDTLECLRSVAQIDYPSFEILLIDNGSKDGLNVACAEFAHVHIVRSETNGGFAAGCNRGLFLAKERGAHYMLLLNNDTIVAPDILQAFMHAAQAYPCAGVLGAKIFYYEEPTLLWHAGGAVNFKTLHCYHEGCTDCDLDKKWEVARELNYACGCALFLRAEVLAKVGGMAEEFFLLWEEIDWCWRIRKAGYTCMFTPTARVWHKISRSFEGGNRGALWQYYYYRNRLLFLKRHASFKRRFTFYLTRFPKEMLGLFFGAVNPYISLRDRKLQRAALKGIFNYFIS